MTAEPAGDRAHVRVGVSLGALRSGSTIALASVLLAGCAGESSTGARVPSHPSPAAAAARSGERDAPRPRPPSPGGVQTGRPQRPPPHAAGAPRRSPTPGAGALPASTADPDAIQPQPAPGSCHARGAGVFSLPDARCTPGATDPAVNPQTLDETICRVGYTKTIRPPEAITEPEKEASMAAYGDQGPLHDYEYDHLVPLELGGARNDPRNLWPEPGRTPNRKDELERELHTMVCAGQLSLAAAQRAIATNWVAAYSRSGAGRLPASGLGH